MSFTTKITKVTKIWMILAATAAIAGQTPPTQTPPAQNPPAGQPGQRGGGQGRGRGGVQVMSLTTTAWLDGGQIPAKYSQAGPETSPPLAWKDVPEGVTSFVLIVHDVDAATTPQTGLTDVLHWMVWNIPGAARSLPAGITHGSELADGSRQMSGTGPYYRGPGAAAAGPAHHYLFELYGLDVMVDVPAVGQSPLATRAAIIAAISGHLRAKASLVGLYKRAPLAPTTSVKKR